MRLPPGAAVISGAGRGFGAALTSVLAAQQWTVYGIVRLGSEQATAIASAKRRSTC